MKYLNIDGLKRFTSNLLGKISVAFDTLADKVGALEVRVPEPTSAEKGKYLRGDGTWAVPPDTKTTVDGTLSTSSTNPVQNKVIAAELDKKIPVKGDQVGYLEYERFGMTITETFDVTGGIGLVFEVSEDGIVRIPHGPVYIRGQAAVTGSDYAKYCEWLDGNTENEDRRGLFVTFEGEKIRIANSDDNFILGVVSAVPGFVENAYETEWQGKYLKDIYGERITQETEVPESTDEEGNTIPAHIETEYVINPEYNEDEKYIPRSERPEWTYVGLTGELVVNDDGTCEVNGYCKPSVGGIATQAETGYRVLARLDESHIKVLIK